MASVPTRSRFLKATQAKAPHAAVAMLLSKYYVAEKNPQKATALLEGLDQVASRRCRCAVWPGATLRRRGAMPQALQQFEWLATKRPSDTVVLNNLAWLYSQKKDPRAQPWPESLQTRAAIGFGRRYAGLDHESKGDTAGGLKYLQQANQASPDDVSVQYHFAFALAKANRKADARAMLGKVVSSNSAPPDIKQSAQSLLAKIGG